MITRYPFIARINKAFPIALAALSVLVCLLPGFSAACEMTVVVSADLKPYREVLQGVRAASICAVAEVALRDGDVLERVRRTATAAVVAIGTFGGKGYFVVATDRLELAVVSPGPNAFAPAGWTVTTTPLTATRRTTPYFAQTADFDGDGDRDVVLGGEGATTVLRNLGTDAIPSFQYGYEVPAAGIPVAAGPLGFVDAAMTIPERPSVVLGGLSGSGLQLLRTDGAGGLR